MGANRTSGLTLRALQVQAFEQKYGQKPSSAPRAAAKEGGEDTEKKGTGVRGGIPARRERRG